MKEPSKESKGSKPETEEAQKSESESVILVEEGGLRYGEGGEDEMVELEGGEDEMDD
jgi:hypothetical protein